MHEIIKTIWVMLVLAGPKEYSPSVISMEFNSRQACIEMVQSLKKQRGDVSGHCSEDFKSSPDWSTINYSTGTMAK